MSVVPRPHVVWVKTLFSIPVSRKEKKTHNSGIDLVFWRLQTKFCFQTLYANKDNDATVWYKFKWPWLWFKVTGLWDNKVCVHFLTNISIHQDAVQLLPPPLHLWKVMLKLFCMISIQCREPSLGDLVSTFLTKSMSLSYLLCINKFGLPVVQSTETSATRSVFLWYQFQRDVHLCLKFRMMFTWTQLLEESWPLNRDFLFTIRNELNTMLERLCIQRLINQFLSKMDWR